MVVSIQDLKTSIDYDETKLITITMSKITLQAKDGKELVIDSHIAKMSTLINETLKSNIKSGSNPSPSTVRLANVEFEMLDKAFQWCKLLYDSHTGVCGPATDWKESYILENDALLFDIILVADVLGIPDLLEHATRTVVDRISGHTPAEIRQSFRISSDFSATEEELVREENSWY